MFIKAIETNYDGILFRSRLEARWALFFNTLNVQYLYEPEGFDFGFGLWYLPDFYLPQLNVWIEIKGVMPNKEEREKAMKLAKGTMRPTYILWGDIGYKDRDDDSHYVFYPNGKKIYFGNYQAWHECKTCRRIGLMSKNPINRKYNICNCGNVYLDKSDRLMYAYNLARKERFDNVSSRREFANYKA